MGIITSDIIIQQHSYRVGYFCRENDFWIWTCLECFRFVLLLWFCFFWRRGSRKRAWLACWPPRRQKKQNRNQANQKYSERVQIQKSCSRYNVKKIQCKFRKISHAIHISNCVFGWLCMFGCRANLRKGSIRLGRWAYRNNSWQLSWSPRPLQVSMISRKQIRKKISQMSSIIFRNVAVQHFEIHLGTINEKLYVNDDTSKFMNMWTLEMFHPKNYHYNWVRLRAWAWCWLPPCCTSIARAWYQHVRFAKTVGGRPNYE